MTEKRYTLEEFGLNFIVNDNGRNLTAKQTVDRLNELNDENEQLKKELFEARKDYILETYADNPIRRDEKLKALEKELEND